MTPSHSPEVRQGDLPCFRVELESPAEGIRRVLEVRAGSMEEALVKVRDAEHWPSGGSGSDPGRFRVVEATEESATSEARHDRNARRRYLNIIVEAGLSALGKTHPEHSDDEFSDVLCDFFTRAITLPGHAPFPAGDAEADRLLSTDDAAAVMVQLLTVHLDHHGLKVAPALPEEQSPTS
ncbi:hypothetical protein [Streptomyces lanatus]|uniref:Uncharacterized protein n=1 Tax=Streptomyces lanatus TaxID=66900 RepID=A0ABV1XRT1_9ACTN|nr:hypothetical protein [Streptomyces lanatus]GHH04552.1 hypothetical protein GCM10018780_35110 [Streptomyces lanatus]